jgi:hypothetical protein
VYRQVYLVALITACARPATSLRTQSWPVDCPPIAPAGSRPVNDIDVESLAGRYEVTLVTLSYGPSYWGGELDLAQTDTLQRFYIQTIRGYVKRGMRPLAGHFYYAADSLHRAEVAEVEDGMLFLGCRSCMDASPDRLRLLAQTPKQVWGLWENQETGIDRLADSAGKPIPNPAGYFCLKRVD